MKHVFSIIARFQCTKEVIRHEAEKKKNLGKEFGARDKSNNSSFLLEP